MSMIRSQPLEIVLVIDLINSRDIQANVAGLRSAALAVLNSLTLQDKVNRLMLLYLY